VAAAQPQAASPALAVVLAAAVLYLARDVLIPLALAILLSFLLAPAVRRLEHWRLGRIGSTFIAVAIAFVLIGAIGWVAAGQALSLAAKLPEYRENIANKVRALRAPHESTLAKATEAIKELESEAAPAAAPLPVTETPPSAFAALAEYLGPFFKPVATALAVVVFTILMLLNRENLRERLIAVIGAQRINVATQALGEASYRVSRYLYMQLLVNACFGIPFGVALHFIGVPNAMLWGLLGTLLRFIPYAGVWVAAALPTLLALAIFDGWSEVVWTLGVFLLLELILVNVVEPWLYGRSAGLSPIAIIAAALFWTWLWGPVGLLLAVPLTVCIAVMGRYVPQLGFLNVLLGVEPVLTPEARLYQRLIALDDEEAIDLAEEYANERGVPALYEDVIIPALGLAEQDRHRGALSAERTRFVFDTVRRIIEDMGDERQAPAVPPTRAVAPLCIVAAHDEADHLAALALARLVPVDEWHAQVIDYPVLASEITGKVAASRAEIACISAVPPHAVMQASYLAKRLKSQLPQLRILVILWTSEDTARAQARLAEAGVNETAVDASGAIERLRQLALAG
jgi:predicted PurR-regulated permease PerM